MIIEIRDSIYCYSVSLHNNKLIRDLLCNETFSSVQVHRLKDDISIPLWLFLLYLYLAREWRITGEQGGRGDAQNTRFSSTRWADFKYRRRHYAAHGFSLFLVILGDPGAVSRVGRKGGTKVFIALGSDSHRTISKNSSGCRFLIGHKKCFELLCPIGEHISMSSFRVFVHDGYCLDHGLPSLSTKEMHAVRKLSV